MKNYAGYGQKNYSNVYYEILFYLPLANDPNTQMLETEDEESWEGFCAFVNRPVPTVEGLTADILHYSLSQIHDRIGEPEEESHYLYWLS